MSLIASYQTLGMFTLQYTKTNSQLPFIYLTLTIAQLLKSQCTAEYVSGHRIVGH